MGIYEKAFLFNGIGSRMEKLTAEMPPVLFDRFMTLRDETIRSLGLQNDPAKNSPLDNTVITWITSSVCDRIIFDYYAEKGIHPDICAGYSSGIGNLCACLGTIPFDFSYEIFPVNGQTITRLEEAKVDLDMGTIIGLDADTVRDIIDGLGLQDSVVIGSVNSTICVMISGYRQSVEKVLAGAQAEGALKAIQMHLPVAFHNPYIIPYNEHFKEFCLTREFLDPPVPVVSAIDQRLITTGEDLRYENYSNVTKQMRWDLTIKKLQELGVTEIYDVSADCAVKKFSKWDKKKSKFFTYLDV